MCISSTKFVLDGWHLKQDEGYELVSDSSNSLLSKFLANIEGYIVERPNIFVSLYRALSWQFCDDRSHQEKTNNQWMQDKSLSASVNQKWIQNLVIQKDGSI